MILYSFSNKNTVASVNEDMTFNEPNKSENSDKPNKSEKSDKPNKSENSNKPNKSENSNKIIVQFRGYEYDITDFVRKHPGGKQLLLENNGNDIEKLMLENEHSANAYNILEKYKIK
jgi:cytochrome b involved in lipid metabolism